MRGYNVASEAAVPVPQGVRPTILTGQVGAVVDVLPGGRVDVVDSRGTFLGSIPIPVGPASAPFVVDISAAQINNGVAGLSFFLRVENTPSNTCVAPPNLDLSQLATSFSGPTPNPRTVADFLPGYLDQIVIRVGPNPSSDQQQAALDLVAKLTNLYRPIPVRVDVDTSPEGAPPAPSRRVIDLRGTGKAGMTVLNPDTPAAVLAISGNGDELQRQVALFTDRRYELVQSPSASVGSLFATDRKSSGVRTFGELGMTGQISVWGTTTLYTGFDVGAFGVGSIGRAKVHLMAKYSPVTGGEGSVLLRSRSTILAAQPLNDSGTLDMNVDIPAETITSMVALSLEVRYTSRQDCTPVSDRITFALDPQSTVTVTPATDDRGGLTDLPMAFVPDFDVAVDSPDHVRFAAQAINLMAQQTSASLRPHVTTFDKASSNKASGLLAVVGGEDMKRVNMNPPLLPGQTDSITANGTPVTSVDGGGPLGIIQAFSQNGREVLAVTGTGDWSLVDPSFDYIRRMDGRWAALTGDIVATGAAGETVNIAIREGGPFVTDRAEPLADSGATGWGWPIWVAISAGVLVLAGLAGFLLVRRRRSTD